MAFNIQAVQIEAVELIHRLAVKHFWANQTHAHRRLHCCTAPNRLVHVGLQKCEHRLCIRKLGVIEAVEVELERFTLNDVGALTGNREVGQCHLGLAAQIKPTQFKRRPHVGAEKWRWRVSVKTNFFPFACAGNREQQGRVVPVCIRRRFAQGRLLWQIHCHYAASCLRRNTKRSGLDSRAVQA